MIIIRTILFVFELKNIMKQQIIQNFIPFKVKANAVQRNSLVKKTLKEVYSELIDKKDYLTINEIQSYVDKKFPHSNIQIGQNNNDRYGATTTAILNKDTKKLEGIQLNFDFDKNSLKLNLVNKIVLIHEFSHGIEILIKK
jgi:hypothetical protein